jgi:hypothetical protein
MPINPDGQVTKLSHYGWHRAAERNRYGVKLARKWPVWTAVAGIDHQMPHEGRLAREIGYVRKRFDAPTNPCKGAAVRCDRGAHAWRRLGVLRSLPDGMIQSWRRTR